MWPFRKWKGRKGKTADRLLVAAKGSFPLGDARLFVTEEPSIMSILSGVKPITDERTGCEYHAIAVLYEAERIV